DRRAAVADVFRAANDLRPVNVSQRDIIGRREVLRRESIQRANIDVTYRVTFTGANGGQVPGGDNRQSLIAVAAQLTGFLILLLVIIRDRPEQMLLFFIARKP